MFDEVDQHFFEIIKEYSTRALEMEQRGDDAAAADFAELFSAATALLRQTKAKFRTRLTRKRAAEVKKLKATKKKKRPRVEPPADPLRSTSFCCSHAKDYADMAAADAALLVGCVCVSMC